LRQKTVARFHEEWKGRIDHGNQKESKEEKQQKALSTCNKGNDGDAMKRPLSFLGWNRGLLQFARAAFFGGRRLLSQSLDTGCDTGKRRTGSLVWRQTSGSNIFRRFLNAHFRFFQLGIVPCGRDRGVVFRL